ncbi:MAG: hypothetical protein JNM00_05765 [Flavobacteriales bacterium]|nr:hypothetical protein [Flavobacteriales bacterium]
MRARIAALLLFLCTAMAHAQDNIGIAASSHAPVNTVLINPSTISDSRAFIDFNLAGFGLFARNDMAFLPGGSFSIAGITEIEEPSYNRATAPYHAYADVLVHGPSVTFNVKQHGFGLYTGLRTVADGRGIPESLGYYFTEGFQYREQMGINYTVSDMRANALAWFEAGFSYATIVQRRADMLTQAGITVKKLFGIAGAGIRLDEWNYTVVDSSHMETYVFRGEYGFNEPAWNSGSGMGFDLGVTFKKTDHSVSNYMPFDPCTDGSYKYRLGFSILDIGSIKFKGPFYRNVFDETEQSEWEDYQGSAADEASDIDSLINSNFQLVERNGDESKFRMALPTAISAQLDYHLGYNFYINSMAMIGLPRKNNLGVQRASYLSVAPRYEIKRFEFALPFTMYEFRQPQIGAMIRLNSLIIGSDNLAWFLGQDIYGADVYLNLKYTIFKHWKCREPKQRKAPRNRGTGKVIPCPSW